MGRQGDGWLVWSWLLRCGGEHPGEDLLDAVVEVVPIVASGAGEVGGHRDAAFGGCVREVEVFLVEEVFGSA